MIVAVSGGKGGVGKSTTAWNLGRELDAVVVDADLSTADLPPGSGPDLHDVLAGRVEPVDAVETVGEVPILPCGRTLSGARAAELDRFGDIIERVERKWGRVVVDCPAGLARDVGVELRTADLAVLVTTPHKPALVDAYRTHDLADDLDTPVASVVVNRIESDRDREIADRLGRELGVDITTIESQSALAEAQAGWVPIRDYEPEASAATAYESLADRLERADERLSDRAESL
ncbi:MinD/ParA family ATP-binding protein [Natranaeroarchaeum aerophilus]|uniref:MinD/ParA family protein n=1 Tax=Natranaeroarchaeum aerophilus TaxID=2917711 RepID=A0AAE3FPV9_9EURY|nr:MinD/ParA family protein [Natranaeroarchaeum aerophilus]MCL9812895.1 MinD/ParA family protein [Natranaeroarchaeum aerophilus]